MSINVCFIKQRINFKKIKKILALGRLLAFQEASLFTYAEFVSI